MFTKLMKGKTFTFNLGLRTTVTVQVQSIRDPKTDYDYTPFRFNVKVISGVMEVPKRDGYMRVKDENGDYVYEEHKMRYPIRSRVNYHNRDIRNRIERELESYAPMFSINRWRLKCDKVDWSL